jgi:hypothetical protein
MMNAHIACLPVKGLTVLLLIASTLALVDCTSMQGKEAAAPTADWFHSLRDSVLANVKDKERARNAIALINQADQAVLEYVSEAEENAERLRMLNTDYDATREDFAAAFASVDASNHAIKKLLLGLRGELIAVVEREEWGSFELSRSLIEVHTENN